MAQTLDGMVFTGRFGAEGKPADRNDTLYFNDGMFWSENCVPCGFPPALYWIRHTDEGIRFRGRLHSDKRGTFSYDGLVSEGVMTASINWQRERWYWTINRNFWFEGEVTDTTYAVNPRQVTAEAATAEPPEDPSDCSP